MFVLVEIVELVWLVRFVELAAPVACRACRPVGRRACSASSACRVACALVSCSLQPLYSL